MYVVCDASQLEWRSILQLSQDLVGIEEVLAKADAHSLNQVAFNLPSRLIAKIYLFRTIFRGSGWSFANDANFMHVSANPKYWDAVNEKFFAKYHGIDACHKVWAESVVNHGVIHGPLGRSWTIGVDYDKWGNLKIPWTMLSNYPVQGVSADVMMIARISANKRLKASGIPFKWRITIHDSLGVDTEEKYVEDIAAIFEGVFADLPKNIKNLFGYIWNVPMACETKYGMNLKEMTKVK